jgi:hypothetical protein
MVPVAFADVWKVARAVGGQVSEEEAKMLYQFAISVAQDQTIVEVGCYHGRSTIILAASGRRVVAFDPMPIGHEVDGKKIAEEDVTILRENLVWWPNVSWNRKNPQDAKDFRENVGLVLIDGRHVGAWPRLDYECFEPRMTKGAHVIFHGYLDAPSVKECVDALIIEKRLTLQQTVCKAAICRVDREGC